MKQRKRVSKRHRRGFSLTCRYPTLFLWWYSFKVVRTMYTSFQLSSGFNLKRTGQKAVQIHSSTFVQLYQHWGLYGVTMTTYPELQLPALITWKFIRWSRSPIFLNDSFLPYKKEMHSGWNKMQRWKRDIWVRNFLFQLNAAKKSKKNKSSGSSDFFSCKMHGDFKEKYHIHFP